MATKYQVRRDTSGNWTSVNPILAQGEMGWEMDTLKMKIGDGTSNWSSLPYVFEGAAAIAQHEAAANPHPVYQSQIDANTTLIGTSSTQDRDRSNHTGTQLASTISDLDSAIANYLDRTVNESSSEQVVIGNTFQDRLNINITAAHTSTYLIDVVAIVSNDVTTSNFQAELLIDGSVVSELDWEHKDAGGAGGASGTDQRVPMSARATLSATSGQAYNIQIRFRAQATGVEATFKQHTLTIERFL